ncbi:hypothetical protein [Chitinophaga polysaccharea]|uniref:hypothetical protein n=1 Tax=Chitinophaga polysaccharea TaxID=1293035 RepID=UPI001158D630|nr:hypothetical protein [Chitinophaga polysaccharea]
MYGNYLTFKDEGSFKKAIADSRNLTDKEQLQFEIDHGFASMASSYREFDQKISLFESARDTTGFYIVSNKHQSALYWKAADEYYINSPDWETSKVINKNGLVKIGENIIKFEHDRKISLKNNDLQTLNKALAIKANVATATFSVDYHPKSVASTESLPGYKWLNLYGNNPQEGMFSNSVTDQYQYQANNRRFTFAVWLVNIRKAGVLYAFAELHYSGMRKVFLFWQRAKVTGVTLNGSMRIKMTSNAVSPYFTCRYINYGVADRWYENYYNDDIEGHEIFAISEKLVNHPDPYSILGPPGIPPQLPYYVDMRKHPEAPNYFFNDKDDFGGNLQLNPDYYWSHIESGFSFGNPNSLTTCVANVEGETFEINF